MQLVGGIILALLVGAIAYALGSAPGAITQIDFSSQLGTMWASVVNALIVGLLAALLAYGVDQF